MHGKGWEREEEKARGRRGEDVREAPSERLDWLVNQSSGGCMCGCCLSFPVVLPQSLDGRLLTTLDWSSSGEQPTAPWTPSGI